MRYSDLTITRRWAAFSQDRRHRYLLGRQFQAAQGDLLSGWAAPREGACVWVMLNPSVADERGEDPTLRRCISFSAAWGFRELQVVNLFSAVATDPEHLLALEDPNGPRADAELRAALRRATQVVVGWGARGGHLRRDTQVRTWLRRLKVPVVCLGVTQEGQPKHPLYLPTDAAAQPFLSRGAHAPA